MLPEITISFAVGLALGFLIAWTLGRSREQAQRQRAAQLEQQLAERAVTLESTQRERDSGRQELTAQQQTAAERDASQREEIAKLTEARTRLEKDAERAGNAIEEFRIENNRLRNDLSSAHIDLAALRLTLENEQKSAQEKLDLLTNARNELSNQFKALAGDILKENSKEFTVQNQTNIGNLLNPLKDKFGEFQQGVENLKNDNVAGRTALKAQLDQLSALNTQLSQDANNLATALKGSSKVQGDWGELVLERILEASGLHKGCEYRVQESFTREQPNEDGRRRARLDVIVYLPEGRHIVIDSKVSCNAYDEYCRAEDDGARKAALSRHMASVRNHVNELSKRDYQSLYQLNSLDCVVMFVPIEPAFMLALASDDDLWEEAWSKNILLVSRTSLLFVLRTVAHLWRQENQAKNHQEIVRRGKELYDKLAAFAEDLLAVGKKIGEARDSYDEAVKKLSTGRGNAIRQAEMLKTLGVKPSKAIPMVLIEQAVEDAPLELAASGEDSNLRP
ncbi:MAG: DNA recombination protein RmuC [Acidobacteriaceae bacterium]